MSRYISFVTLVAGVKAAPRLLNPISRAYSYQIGLAQRGTSECSTTTSNSYLAAIHVVFRPFPIPIAAMFSLRFARSALRAQPAVFRAPMQQRTYAQAVAEKLKLSLALPTQVCIKTANEILKREIGWEGWTMTHFV